MLISTPPTDWLAGYTFFVWSQSGADLPATLPGTVLCEYRRKDRYGVLLLLPVPHLIGPGVCPDCGEQRALSCRDDRKEALRDVPRLPEGLDREPFIPLDRVLVDDTNLTVVAWKPLRLVDREQPHRAWLYLRARP